MVDARGQGLTAPSHQIAAWRLREYRLAFNSSSNRPAATAAFGGVTMAPPSGFVVCLECCCATPKTRRNRSVLPNCDVH